MGDCRGWSATACFGRAGPVRPRLFSALLRRAPMRRPSNCSSTSGGKGGEILGRLGDRAAAGRRDHDATPAGLARRDSDMLAWCGSQLECASAVARLERAGHLDRSGGALAFDRLKQLADGWREIEPSEIVRENAPAVSSRSSASGGRCASACSGLPRRRTPSLVARSRHARRPSRRRGAEGRVRVDRRCRGLNREQAFAIQS